MQLPSYDVIIKAAKKDYFKLEFVVESIKFLIPEPNKIYIVSHDGFLPKIKSKLKEKIVIIKDDEVFPGLDRNRILYRKNWIFSMLVALFQDFTVCDYYLDIQADNIFTSDVILFNNSNLPRFFVSENHDHYHKPYFDFSLDLFELDRQVNYSFIIDFMMYKKSVTKDMLKKYGNFYKFFEKAILKINSEFYPAEQELYPNWCIKNNIEYEIVRDVKVNFNGIYFPGKFSKLQINSLIKRSKDYLALSIHTWGDETTLSSKKGVKIQNTYIKLSLWFPKTIGILKKLIRKIK